MINQGKKIFGFTLVELMAALAVVMVLVALALPRFRLFIATARQAEAQSNLGIIASLQQTYQLKYNGNYFDTNFDMGKGKAGGDCLDANQKNELGFRVVNCRKLRYTYNPTSSGGGEAENDGNQVLKIYPNCSGSIDKWSITDGRVLKNNSNIIEACDSL